MSDRPAPAHRGIVPGQVAEIIVAVDGEAGWRGSGYRVGPTAVLTEAHVVQGAASVQVRFDADRSGEWSTEAISCWTDPRSDLAVLTIAPREGEPPVTVARFGRIGDDRDAVLTARAVGFPRFKLKTYDDTAIDCYRDSHQTDGSVAVLSNRREGTLEVTVSPPERDPDPATSPWDGMSGAALWVGDRIVGVIAKHHRSDGLGRLAAARLDLALEGLDQVQRAELRTLLCLPDALRDVVPPSASERIITAYQAMVRNIAPDQLLDREEELNELVGFCAGDQPYAWWQAGPWAGKSALMSWFVLHPPAGVDVVSFFVTARLAGQSDSDAYTNALIEQLAALVGESPASLLTVGARQGTMVDLLENAASRSREAGRRLLLVIDGLDEDSGATTGSSIAALLPRQPPSEVRVLVVSRPHPPIPDDVPGGHPLRTLSPRQLDVSEHARDAEHRAKHELTQLLAGTQLQRDVLGLITAAGGGLTLDDLEELTGPSLCGIGGLLGGVFGRSVERRVHTPASGHPGERGYLFAHETLQRIAEQRFGKSLTSYRDRLHHWADTYQQRGWPTDTPHYLLRGYPRMLASSGDLPRLVACATDQVRHDRMRDLTGGDTLAFTEISIAQQLILAQPDPDLTSLALLAVQREYLTDRNLGVPAELPVVWAKLGQPTRAEALANGIPDLYRRVWALSDLVEVAAGSGDHDRAAQLVSDAEALTVQITDPGPRAEVLGRLAVVVAKGGDRNRAVRLTDEAKALTPQITRFFERAGALGQLAEAAAACGDQERCKAFMSQISDRSTRAQVLGRLAAVVTRSGDRDRAVRLAGEAETLIASITDPDLRAEALSEFAEIVAESEDQNLAVWLASEADALTAQVIDPYQRVKELRQLADAVAESGDRDQAVRLFIQTQALITQITYPGRRAEALVKLAEVVVAHGDYGWATRLISESETLTSQFTDRDWLYSIIINQQAHVVATCGDYSRAEVLIAKITDPGDRVSALGWLAKMVAGGGDRDQVTRLVSEAQAVTAQLTDPYPRALALSQLADAVFAGGDEDQAVRLADEAEALAGQFTDPRQQAPVFGQLADLAAAGGDYDRAEALIVQIVEPGTRAGALGQLAEAVDADGDQGRAARLVSEAEVLTDRIPNRYQRAEALASLAVTLLTITESTTPVREHPHRSSPALVHSRSLLAEALAIGSWDAIVFDLAFVDPSAVSALADELEERWKLHASATPGGETEHRQPG